MLRVFINQEVIYNNRLWLVEAIGLDYILLKSVRTGEYEKAKPNELQIEN